MRLTAKIKSVAAAFGLGELTKGLKGAAGLSK